MKVSVHGVEMDLPEYIRETVEKRQQELKDCLSLKDIPTKDEKMSDTKQSDKLIDPFVDYLEELKHRASCEFNQPVSPEIREYFHGMADGFGIAISACKAKKTRPTEATKSQPLPRECGTCKWSDNGKDSLPKFRHNLVLCHLEPVLSAKPPTDFCSHYEVGSLEDA